MPGSVAADRLADASWQSILDQFIARTPNQGFYFYVAPANLPAK